MNSAFQDGEVAFESGDYESAISLYTKALADTPAGSQRSQIYLKRATAYQRQKQYGLALQDCATALEQSVRSRNFEQSGEAYFRQGVIHFLLGRFPTAKQNFDIAEKTYHYKSSALDVWNAKVAIELGKLPQGYVEPEVPTVGSKEDKESTQSTQSQIVSTPTSASASAPIISAPAVSVPTSPAITAPSAISKPSVLSPDFSSFRYDHFQSASTLSVSLYVKNAPQDSVDVQFSPRAVAVSIPKPDGEPFRKEFAPLYGEIVTRDCSYQVYPSRIEVQLAKAEPGRWPAITSGEPETEQPKAKPLPLVSTEDAGSLGPTKPVKNWDALVDSDDEEEAAEADPNAFFRQIFKNADPDTQRAMMKSYIESNGTALSTNWDEVSKGKVATEPPSGMEAKPF